MTVPDASMKAGVSAKNKNAKTLEEGSKALFDLVSDTTSEKNKWLPAIMPDGIYCVGNGGDGGKKRWFYISTLNTLDHTVICADSIGTY